MCSGGGGISCKYRLKSVGLNTEPCGTPFEKHFVMDDSPLLHTNYGVPER